MSERKYEHTVDLDGLVEVAAQYEKVIVEGDKLINETEDRDVLRIANIAAEALELQQRLVFQLMPDDLREAFQDALEEAVAKEPAGA